MIHIIPIPIPIFTSTSTTNEKLAVFQSICSKFIEQKLSHILFLSWSAFQARHLLGTPFWLLYSRLLVPFSESSWNYAAPGGWKCLQWYSRKRKVPGWCPRVFNLVLRWVETDTLEMWRHWRVCGASQWKS